MKLQAVFMIVTVLVSGCQSDQSENQVDYPNQMGEISFDATKDDPDFTLCNEQDLVHSRTSLSYRGGRKRIEEISREMFSKATGNHDFSGYIIVRFLVNCQGETGRLRIEPMDDGFMEQAAPAGLIDLIRSSVEALDEWTITKPVNKGKDHSKYLNFKIKNGQIDAITH
ncbi:MAG: hypothetical protein Roseis2KO_41160 [Roseivirga sp.]